MTDRIYSLKCPHCDKASTYVLTADEHAQTAALLAANDGATMFQKGTHRVCGMPITVLKALSIYGVVTLALGREHDMIPDEGALRYPDDSYR